MGLAELLEYLAEGLVDDPEQVTVERFDEAGGAVVLELAVGSEDYGKVIGRGGRTAQALRTVIVPQAVRNVVPPLLNDFIALTKDVALVSIIGPQEAARVAQIFQDQNFNFTPLMAAAAVYLCVTIPLIRIVDHLQWRRIRQQGSVLALGPR